MIGHGLHLLIDGFSYRGVTAEDAEGFILRCAEEIGMTIVYGPVSAEIPGGVQAVAIIAESHIIVKALTNGLLLIDVFSCFAFDTGIPVWLANTMLGLRNSYTLRTIPRAGLGPRVEPTTLALTSTPLPVAVGPTTTYTSTPPGPA